MLNPLFRGLLILVIAWSATKTSAQRPDERTRRVDPGDGSQEAVQAIIRQPGFSLPLAATDLESAAPAFFGDRGNSRSIRQVSYKDSSEDEPHTDWVGGGGMDAIQGLVHVAERVPAARTDTPGSVRLAAPSTVSKADSDSNGSAALQQEGPAPPPASSINDPLRVIPAAPDQFGGSSSQDGPFGAPPRASEVRSGNAAGQGDPKPVTGQANGSNVLPAPKTLESELREGDEAVGLPSILENEGLVSGSVEWVPGEVAIPSVLESREGRYSNAIAMGKGRRFAADYWTPWAALRRRVPKSGPLRWLSDFHWQHRGRANSITCDLGIGHERVMFAPQIVDTPISTANVSLVMRADRGIHTIDRLTYVWSPQSIGPGYDPQVNLLDTRLRMELGGKRLMAITEFTMRSLDPTLAPNTTGFGDMIVGAKSLLLDGRRLKIASVFRSYLPTGPSSRGLGVGHTAIEPGLATRYCLSPKTYVFSELKYWTPFGEDPNYGGDILICGTAFSTVFSESDVYAILPTIELRTLSFLFGGQSIPTGVGNPPPQTRQAIDGITAVEIYPGARFVIGPRGDLGLLELNVAAGFTIADDEWFDTRLQLGLRWNY